MPATREHVLREFPELAKPGVPYPPSIDPEQLTNEQHIQGWIDYWNTCAHIHRSKKV